MRRLAGIVFRKTRTQISSVANVALCGIGETSKNVGVVHSILVVSVVAQTCTIHLCLLLVVLLRGFAGYGGHHPSHGLPSVVTAGRPCEGWWRWRESNPRPKQLQSNFYARSRPLISQEICRLAGLSPSNRSVVRGPDARAERFRPSPAELCRGGLAGVCRATSGP